MPPQPLESAQPEASRAEQASDGNTIPKQLPKGVVLGKDGKPCRSCTSVSSWMAMAKQHSNSPPTSETPAMSLKQPPADCPPDVEELGRSTWTLLHTMAASYPEQPSPIQQSETRQFMQLFGKMYPCWVCADDFRAWMGNGNEPRVSNRDEFGRWLCQAHNAVNVKLGKQSFDCNKWQERWRTGWKDGRCD